MSNNKIRKFRTKLELEINLNQEELSYYDKNDLINFHSIIRLYLDMNSFELKNRLANLINDDIKDTIMNKYKVVGE